MAFVHNRQCVETVGHDDLYVELVRVFCAKLLKRFTRCRAKLLARLGMQNVVGSIGGSCFDFQRVGNARNKLRFQLSPNAFFRVVVDALDVFLEFWLQVPGTVPVTFRNEHAAAADVCELSLSIRADFVIRS